MNGLQTSNFDCAFILELSLYLAQLKLINIQIFLGYNEIQAVREDHLLTSLGVVTQYHPPAKRYVHIYLFSIQ